MSSTVEASVSCVVTSYNYGRFLTEAISSLLQQTYPLGQIIVVDDGSTDDSGQVAKRFGKRIELIQQRNSGVVIARNNGAKRATGEYIFFLDADDTVAPNFVEQLVSALQAHPESSFAYCDYAYFGLEEGQIVSCPWNPRKLLYRNYIVPCAVMKKAVFDKVGGYNQALNQTASFEDWDLWLSLLETSTSGQYVPGTLFNYRLHGKGRNGLALQKRPDMEQQIRHHHPKLYTNFTNRMYLLVFGTLSKLRNAFVAAPGTGQLRT